MVVAVMELRNVNLVLEVVMRSASRFVLVALMASALVGCGLGTTPDLGTLLFPVSAYCTAQVDGVGAVDVENDYLPHVVACENGSADFEALKAQAVSARSVLYHSMATHGHIGDGTHAQVYSCNRPPSQVHYDAVAATSGQVLVYNDNVIYAFYVAGAIPGSSSCVADPDYPGLLRVHHGHPAFFTMFVV